MYEQIIQEFKDTLNSIYQLNDAEWEMALKKITIKEFKKNSFIHRQGDQIQSFSFLSKGYLRWFFTKNKKEYTVQIFNKRRFIADLTALKTGNPSEFYLQALTNCTVIEISVETMYNLLSLSPSYEKINRDMYEHALVDEMQRIKDILSLSPFELYKKFMLEFPDLAPRLTQVKAASCINISQESFSRFKKMTEE